MAEKNWIEEKRAIVQEMERKIKALVKREEWCGSYFFRKFSEKELDELGDYFSDRNAALDALMSQPTEEEIERMGYQNDKLFRLTQECYEQCRNLWLMLYESPHKVNDRYRYDVDGVVRFEYGADDAVITMKNDDYYGSDFSYMIKLQDEMLSQGRYKMDTIVNGTSCDFLCSEKEAMDQLTNELDDGQSWNEGRLFNKAFDKCCICYAMHALHTHQNYCLPDILRMDDFVVRVELSYEQEICDTRDSYSKRYTKRWGRGVPYIKKQRAPKKSRQM